MKKLVCEMRSGADLVKQDGVFVCQNCGTKYSVEEARKMMMEGTVSIEGTVSVDGVVKVDKSEELKKLYTLARRAKESDNTENAVRYYTQIEMQDPESWEAYFYLIYFKARTTKIGEIHKDCKNLSNCFSTTFELLASSVTNNEERMSVLKAIIDDIHFIGKIMVSSARSVSAPWEYWASVLEMMESLGDKILQSFPNYPELAAQAWKTVIDVFVSVVCYGEYKKDSPTAQVFTNKDYGVFSGYYIPDVAKKIYEIDPTYEDPFGVAKKLRKNEKFINCPKCGKAFRERESACPECGCTKQEMEQIAEERRIQSDKEAEERRIQAEKEAEEARIRAEQEAAERAARRKEWWQKNKTKVIVIIIILLCIISAIICVSTIQKNKSIAMAEQAIASGDSCVVLYEFDKAEEYYIYAGTCSNDYNTQVIIYNKKAALRQAREDAVAEYNEALRRLKIYLEADDYIFNKYSNQYLDKMIELDPERKETIYYQNLRKQ